MSKRKPGSLRINFKPSEAQLLHNVRALNGNVGDPKYIVMLALKVLRTALLQQQAEQQQQAMAQLEATGDTANDKRETEAGTTEGSGDECASGVCGCGVGQCESPDGCTCGDSVPSPS